MDAVAMAGGGREENEEALHEVRSRCDVIEWGARQVARRGSKICLISFCFIDAATAMKERQASIDGREI
jgi:hypothetical protein